MPKTDWAYEPLRISIDPQDDDWDGKGMGLLGQAVLAWEWKGPARKKKLPSLIALEPNSSPSRPPSGTSRRSKLQAPKPR